MNDSTKKDIYTLLVTASRLTGKTMTHICSDSTDMKQELIPDFARSLVTDLCCMRGVESKGLIEELERIY
ncbi:hypothetical protein [Vibrio barjaei]|uniref:hypothetical protein n=1 Tax=Vibrio barjaei TaxID=1676683 RepID=UPI0022834BD6|nr:hypothetical protein [Vibrio barjaei]MCY9873846.1 hypothetical protein [Vibrio barjaei]